MSELRIISNETEINLTNVTSTQTTKAISLHLAHYYGVNVVWKNGVALNANVVIQISIDKENWVNLSTPIPITASSGTIILDEADFSYLFFRVRFEIVSGSCDLKIQTLLRG